MESKVDLGHARVVTMRELNQRTSAVIEELNATGESAVITKHGKFVAVLHPLGGHKIESMVLSADNKFLEELRREESREESREEKGHTRSFPLDTALAFIED